MNTREIKFRGKDKDNNWVNGDLIHGVFTKKGNLYILPLEHNLAHIPNCHYLDGVKIENETIGQFTGQRDCKRTKEYPNGQKIYEGDICLCDVNGIDYITIVYFKHGTYYLQDNVKEGNLSLSWFIDNNKKIEVIGNIHDNPELINKIGKKE